MTASDALPDQSSIASGSKETAAEERPRQHKRTRAAMDPGTPKGEEGEPKGLTSSTPVAKKGRVEDDGEAPREGGASPGSEPGNATPPRSTSTEVTSATPSTPAVTSETTEPPRPATEGKETKQIRERVAAMKASHQSEDHENQDKDMNSVAETAAEVSVSAAKLGDEQVEKQQEDTEIAEVAAEVGKSAELVNGTTTTTTTNEGGKGMKTEEAKVADEVSRDAAKLEKEDEVIADSAAETAEAARAVPEQPKPVAKSTSFVPYTGGGSSSFSAFSSTTSPFASVSTPVKSTAALPPPAPTPADSQKPKTKTAFSASPFLASSIPLAKKPEPSTTSSSTLLTPSTPASKPLSSNSPFSAFASTSGFASAKKPAAWGLGSSTTANACGTPSTSSSASAFSSYSAAPSAFASVPSTPSSKSPLPPSDQTTTSSVEEDARTPTSKQAATKESFEVPVTSSEGGGGGRKIGEPEEPDENRRIYTEQTTHTGEESDKVVHNVRAKLFAMHEGNWVERGMGPLKVNLTTTGGEKSGARIVMRADATHRLLLNSPLFKEFFIEVSNEKYVRFTIIEGSEPISYMARLGNPAAAEALVNAIRERTSAL